MLCSVWLKCCFHCYGDCNWHTGCKFVLIYLDSSIEPVFNTFHTCDDVVVRWSESLQVAEEEWPIVLWRLLGGARRMPVPLYGTHSNLCFENRAQKLSSAWFDHFLTGLAWLCQILDLHITSLSPSLILPDVKLPSPSNAYLLQQSAHYAPDWCNMHYMLLNTGNLWYECSCFRKQSLQYI